MHQQVLQLALHHSPCCPQTHSISQDSCSTAMCASQTGAAHQGIMQAQLIYSHSTKTGKGLTHAERSAAGPYSLHSDSP